MNSELIELKKQFSAWRQSKTSRVTPVPPELRAAAVGQLPHYTLSKLCSQLSLSRVMLSDWQAGIKGNSAALEYTKIFVPEHLETEQKKKISITQYSNNSNSLATVHFRSLKIELQNFDALNSVMDRILSESLK